MKQPLESGYTVVLKEMTWSATLLGQTVASKLCSVVAKG